MLPLQSLYTKLIKFCFFFSYLFELEYQNVSLSLCVCVNIFGGCTDDNDNNDDDYDDDTSEQQRRRYKMHTFFRNTGIFIMLCYANVCNVYLLCKQQTSCRRRWWAIWSPTGYNFFFFICQCLFLSVNVYMMIPKWKVVTETLLSGLVVHFGTEFDLKCCLCHFRRASKWSAEQMTFNHKTWLLLPLSFYLDVFLCNEYT